MTHSSAFGPGQSFACLPRFWSFWWSLQRAACGKWGHGCFGSLGGRLSLSSSWNLSVGLAFTLRNQLLSHAQFRIIKKPMAEKRAVIKDKEQVRESPGFLLTLASEQASYLWSDGTRRKLPLTFSPSLSGLGSSPKKMLGGWEQREQCCIFS